MRTVALISGGKDSCYNMMQCVSEGHEIVALANLRPNNTDEMDSFMYQTVGHHAIDLYAEAIDLPLYRRTIKGGSVATSKDYVETADDEVEDLYQLLSEVKEKHDIEAVSVGAVLSDYQRVRVENICQRLGLTSLSYLWRRNQAELLNEMIKCGVEAILIKVASLGLLPKKHLGKSLKVMQEELMDMHDKYELNVCGEGGEYETFTLDCPLFNKKIVLDNVEMVIHSDDAFAPVGYLNLKEAHLDDKEIDHSSSFMERLKHLPMKRSSDVSFPHSPDELAPSLLFYSLSNVNFSCKTQEISAGIKPQVKQKNEDVWISGIMGKYSANQSLRDITETAMEQLKSILLSLGDEWDMGCIVYVHLYVQNMADFAEINAVYKTYFGINPPARYMYENAVYKTYFGINPPARYMYENAVYKTCFGINPPARYMYENAVYKTYFGINPPARVCVQAQLPKDVAVQIDCYGNCDMLSRQTIHVQGLSHWAPANIGPYSQCVKVKNRLYVAGQIPLVPGCMQILKQGIQAEAKLALQHVSCVLDAMHPGCTIVDTSHVVCYVTHPDYVEAVRMEWIKYLFNYFTTETEMLMGRPHVTYVIVPTLPRGASVEWQVTATINGPHKIDKRPSNCDILENVEGRNLSFPPYSARLSELGLHCADTESDDDLQSDKYFFFSLYMHQHSKELCTKSIANSLCSVIKSGLEKAGKDVCLPLLRIFYMASKIDYNDLHNALTETFRELIEESVVFSLVPVHGFKKNNTNLIINVCC